jgi:hypothetical protein
MKRLFCAGIVLVAAPVAGAAPYTSAVRTVANTRAPITRFAEDRGWLAWTTEKSCAERVALRSLRTGGQIVKPLRSEARCSSSRFDALAVAGGRAIWTTLYGAGNTELDFAIGTMSVADPHPRTVRKMAMVVPEFGPDPLPPPVAGRGRLLVYYRHEDGILAQPTHDLERVERIRPRRIAPIGNPIALAVDRGRIAAVEPVAGRTHYTVRASTGGELNDGEIDGTPVAVALDGRDLAILKKDTATGAKAIVVLDARSGTTVQTVPVPASTTGSFSASGGRAVYAVGREIYAVTLDSGATRHVAAAAGEIAGLAISGSNVYWGENAAARGRIRVARLQP